jgi:hypothetical protein
MMNAFTIGSLTPGQFDHCLPDARRGHLQYLTLLCFATGAREGSRPHQHRNIANEIPRSRIGQHLLLTFARFEHLQLTGENYCQAEISLTRAKNHLAPPQYSPYTQWFQHRKLPIVQFRKSDAFGVAVKSLILFKFCHIGTHSIISPPNSIPQ